MYVYLSLASPLGEAPARRRVMRERLPGQSVYGIQRQGRPSSGPSGHLSPPWGKALLQCCGFSGNGGVLLGNRGGGVGAEAVKFRGQLIVGHS